MFLPSITNNYYCQKGLGLSTTENKTSLEERGGAGLFWENCNEIKSLPIHFRMGLLDFVNSKKG